MRHRFGTVSTMTGNGQIEVAKLAQLLADGSDTAMLVAVGGPAVGHKTALWRAEIIVSAAHLPVEQRIWTYETCTFASCNLPASDLAGWLVTGEPQQFDAGPINFEFSLFSHAYAQHKPRWAQHDNQPIDWPSVSYSLSLVADSSQPFQPPSDMLIGADAPAFVTFGVAFNAFFYDNFTLTGSSNPALGNIEIRVVDGRGRIGAIAIKPTHLEVQVDGFGLSSANIELMATVDRTTISLNAPGLVEVPLPNGLPSDAWLWLRTPNEWLDYRSLGGWASYRSPDVRDDRPTEPEADLESIIAQGEGQNVEFKRQLPDNTPSSRRTVFKTITAFANGQGGSVLFGITDDGEVIGIADNNGDSGDRFHNMLRSSTSPTPPCHVYEQSIGNKQVLVVEVEANKGTIYSVTTEAERSDFYVRRGATTFHATGEELEKIIGNAPQVPSNPWLLH